MAPEISTVKKSFMQNYDNQKKNWSKEKTTELRSLWHSLPKQMHFK